MADKALLPQKPASSGEFEQSSGSTNATDLSGEMSPAHSVIAPPPGLSAPARMQNSSIATSGEDPSPMKIDKSSLETLNAYPGLSTMTNDGFDDRWTKEMNPFVKNAVGGATQSSAKGDTVQIHIFMGKNAEHHAVVRLHPSEKLMRLNHEIVKAKEFQICGTDDTREDLLNLADHVQIYQADGKELEDFAESLTWNRLHLDCFVVAVHPKVDGVIPKDYAPDQTVFDAARDKFESYNTDAGVAAILQTSQEEPRVNTLSNSNDTWKTASIESMYMNQTFLGANAYPGLSGPLPGPLPLTQNLSNCSEFSEMYMPAEDYVMPQGWHIQVFVTSTLSFLPWPLDMMSLAPDATVEEIERQIKDDQNPKVHQLFSCKSFKVQGLLPFFGPIMCRPGFLKSKDLIWQAGFTTYGCGVLAYIEPKGSAQDLSKAMGNMSAEALIQQADMSPTYVVPSWSDQSPTPGDTGKYFSDMPEQTSEKKMTKCFPPEGDTQVVPDVVWMIPEKSVPEAPSKVPIVTNEAQPLIMKAMSKVASQSEDGIFQFVVKGEHGGWDHLVFWKSHAGVLKKMDKQFVSKQQDAFRLPIGDVKTERGPGIPFIFMIHPKQSYLSKGGNCFKKAKGCVTIEVKCTMDLATTTASREEATIKYSLAVGGTSTEKLQTAPRGPQSHNFFDNATASLHKSQEQWNLSSVVNEKEDNKFIIGLQVHNLASKGDIKELDLQA